VAVADTAVAVLRWLVGNEACWLEAMLGGLLGVDWTPAGCCDVLQALERLGRLEEGNVSEAFSQLSSRAAELVAARRKGCEALAAKFEAPLKEAVHWGGL
jgi:hypothetical protein